MDDKTKLMICKKHIVYIALSTRLAIIAIQFISNILFVDHNPNVFKSPVDGTNSSLFGKICYTFLGGFLHWDGQYFYHIATYGYTYENTVAFFPLYPLSARFLTIPITYVFPFLQWSVVLLIVFIVLNVFFFVKASLALFDLSVIILNRKLAFRSAFLFCINPASIFFVAPYTECLFSYLTFSAMLKCAETYHKNSKSKGYSSFLNLLSISIPIALSIATRSNGLLNIGFLIYYWLLYFKKTIWPHNIVTLIHVIICGFMLVINVLLCLMPFIAIQMIDFQRFCSDFEHNLPKNVITYAHENNYILPGTFSKNNQTWCYNKLPFAYSYVQSHYWDVGFLKYYELKQIPNFLLALPITFIILRKGFLFAKQYLNYCLNLGIFEFNFNVQNLSKSMVSYLSYDLKMFVFIIHSVILTIFCILCINVQVTTRMLCSASPVLYWFCAYAFDDNSVEFDLFSSWKGFLFNNQLNFEQKFIKYYFLSYFLIGTALFSNNFPWT